MPATDDAIPTARRVCLVCHTEFPAEETRCPKDGTMLVALAADPYAGKTLADRYEIERLVGTGGTSIVYRANHLQLRRTVAIKMLKAHLVTDEESKKRFEQEARAVSCLTHPNVVGVYDVGVTKYGEPYIVMEFLQGVSLAEIVAQEGRITLERGLPIFIQACSALAHAHKKDVVHRDVKPSNIMIVPTDDDPEYVKIVDFGLAKLRSLTGEFQRLTKTGEVFGSPVYMSPEQCTGRKLDQRTDVYSMGVVMYEGLSGRPPFKERTTIETIRKQIKEPAPRFSELNPELKIPEQLESVILRCLTKNPDERYQTMEELRNELESFAFNHNLRSPHISLSSTMPALNVKSGSSGRLRAVGGSQLAEPTKRIPPYAMAIILIVIVLLAFGAFKLLVR
jgi:eukaryotic-like serine/threonine-protein kinase